MAKKEESGVAVVQTPDISSIKTLRQDLSRALHEQIPANLNELKQC